MVLSQIISVRYQGSAAVIIGMTLGMILVGVLMVRAPAWAQSTAGSSAAPSLEARELLAQAKSARRAGNIEQAQLAYQLILMTYPQSPLRDQVFFGLAKINVNQKDHIGAAIFYKKLIKEFPKSPLIRQAERHLAQVYIRLGQYDNALPLLERERSLEQDTEGRLALTNRIIDVYLIKKDYYRAVIELVENQKEGIEDRVKKWLNQNSREELGRLVSRYPDRFPGDRAILELVDRHQSAGEDYEAERELRRFLSDYPHHKFESMVRDQLIEIKRRYHQNQYLIGVLLPLSGELGPFGDQALRGIRLAFDPALSKRPEKLAGIVVRDTASGPDALRKGIDELAREFSVVALIGPMRTRQVMAVARQADRYRIPLLAPTASEEFSESSKYVLRNSITNRQQVRELTRFAVQSLDLLRFCVLYPDDAYGNRMMELFLDEVERQGGEIIAWASYDPEATDFGPQIRRLKEVDLSKYGKMEARPLPPSEMDEDVQDIASTEQGETVKAKETLEYHPGFDAVFIPGDFDQVGLISAHLAFYDVRGVALLGTNSWNSRELIRIGGEYIEGGIFVDGFFAGDPEPRVRAFRDRYRKRYHEEPTLLSAQAYDSAGIFLDALQQGADTGEAIREVLLGIQNYEGVTGKIRYVEESGMVRPVVVLRVKDGKFVRVGEENLDQMKQDLLDQRRKRDFAKTRELTATE